MPIRKNSIATATAIAAAWALAAPLTADASSFRSRWAYTPSGNITCQAQSVDYRPWTLACSAMDPGRTARISRTGKAYESGYTPISQRGRKMAYGKTYYIGPFKCVSDESGLGCWAPHKGGAFWISRGDLETS